jgi:hypothetical protein
MRAPLSVVALVLAAGTAVVCGCTMAYAEPFFFDCHGTFDFQALADPLSPNPTETTGQIMIDLDRGMVEAPIIPHDFPSAGTNEYCSKAWDLQSTDSSPRDRIARGTWQMQSCTTLRVSETAYYFFVNYTYKIATKTERTTNSWWSEGTLNRITGKFHGAYEFRSKYLYVYDMTCVPAQRKF